MGQMDDSSSFDRLDGFGSQGDGEGGIGSLRAVQWRRGISHLLALFLRSSLHELLLQSFLGRLDIMKLSALADVFSGGVLQLLREAAETVLLIGHVIGRLLQLLLLPRHHSLQSLELVAQSLDLLVRLAVVAAAIRRRSAVGQGCGGLGGCPLREGAVVPVLPRRRRRGGGRRHNLGERVVGNVGDGRRRAEGVEGVADVPRSARRSGRERRPLLIRRKGREVGVEVTAVLGGH